MSAPTAIGSVADFQQHEQAMLAVINGSALGPELFLADPFRFLGENGYSVAPALQADLEQRAPALTKLPKDRYDGIKSGTARLTDTTGTQVTWHIRSLGVK